MSEREDVIEDFAEAFDEMRDEGSLGEGVVCYLIKRGEHTQRFTIVKELANSWFVEYGKTRAEIRLYVANSLSNFGDEFIPATHIAFGVPDSSGQISVYGILPDERDTTDPDITSPFWMAVAIREPNERFTIPV